MATDKWFSEMVAESELSAGVERQLCEAGFVVIEDPALRARRARLAEAYDAAVLAAHPDDISRRSSTRIHDFVTRGPEFDDLYLYKPLLAACCRVIGRPFKLSTMLARTLEPGAPMQELHVDFKREADGWPMVGFIIMVDEFRSDNGATRFVPGSHAAFSVPDGVMAEPWQITKVRCWLAALQARSLFTMDPCGTGIQPTDLPSRDARSKAPSFGRKRNRPSTRRPAPGPRRSAASAILPNTFWIHGPTELK